MKGKTKRMRIFCRMAALCLILGMTAACGKKKTVTVPETTLLATEAPEEERTWQMEYDLGVRLLNEGKYEEAILAFTAAIGIDPKQPDAYSGRGDAYYGLAQKVASGGTASGEFIGKSAEELFGSAASDYEKASEMEPENSELKDKLIDSLEKAGEQEKADRLKETGSGEETAESDETETSGEGGESGQGTETTERRLPVGLWVYDAEGNLIRRERYTYNAEGQQIRTTLYDADGKMTSRIETVYYASGARQAQTAYRPDGSTDYAYTYGESGEMLSSVSYREDGTPGTRREWTYDERGRALSFRWYEGDTYLSGSDYTYDDAAGKGHTEYDQEGQDGVADFFWEFTYGADGNILRCEYYNEDRELTGWEESEYDSAGNRVKFTEYGADGSLIAKTETEYNAAGKMTQEIRVDAEGAETRYTNTYNEFGDVLTASYRDDSAYGDSPWQREYTYDEAGSPLVCREYDGEGTLTGYREWEYEGDILYLLTDSVSYNAETGAISSSTVSDYDEKGNLLSQILYRGTDTVEETNVYTYDEEGRMLSRTLTTSAGKQEWMYEYDREGRVSRMRALSTSGTFSWTYYTYDASGNCVREDYADGDGTLQNSWTTYTYDSAGNLLVELDENDTLGECVRVEYEYDSAGNRITEALYSFGNLFRRTENTYDSSGNLISAISYDEREKITAWNEYEYDEAGRQTVLESKSADGEVTFRREYTYDEYGGILEVRNFYDDGTENHYYRENSYLTIDTRTEP